VGNTPGLGDAFEMANNTLEAGVDLQYWQDQVTAQVENASRLDSDAEACSDDDLQEALRLSREHFYGKRTVINTTRSTNSLFPPSLSPPSPGKYASSQRLSGDVDTGSASSSILTSSRQVPSRAITNSLQPSSSSSSSRNRGGLFAAQSAQDRLPVERPFQHGSFFDNQLGGLDRGRKQPISDTIEGEL
jgi:hypothetical protein